MIHCTCKMAQGAISSVAVGPPVLLQAMSQRAAASQCGGVVVEFETDDIRDARDKKSRSVTGELNFKPTMNYHTIFAVFIYIFLHFPTRFRSYLPQGSQVSHLCQWGFVNVGKNLFLWKPHSWRETRYWFLGTTARCSTRIVWELTDSSLENGT